MLDEKTLVISLKNGNHSAFINLYDQYHTRLYNFVRTSINSDDESQDIVQIVFMRLWEKHGDLNPDFQFRAYLYTIARNLIYNHLRAKLYRQLYTKATENIPTTDSNEESLIENDFKIFFANLIEKLPERRQQIFVMSRSENKSYIQIAQELNISENTVDTQIRKSLDFLRKNLKKEEILLFLFILNNF